MNNHIKFGLIILFFLLLFSVISIIIFGFNISTNIDEKFEQIFGTHFLGTDNFGRDILSSVIFGLWFSIFTAFAIALLSSFIGITIGIISGYFEGLFEIIFLRIGDILLAFPGFLLIILLVSALGNNFFTLIIAISSSGWIGYARIVRSEVLKYKNTEFILAAKAYNASFFRLIFFHIFPHLIPVLLVQASIHLSNIILIESTLGFLGLGIDPQTPTLGHLVFNGQAYLFQKPSLILLPGIILFLLILSINFIGEGLQISKNKIIKDNNNKIK